MDRLVTMSTISVQLSVVGISILSVWIGLITALGAWSNQVIVFWGLIVFGFVGLVLLLDMRVESAI
jgi:hypothetical protein